MHQYSVIDPRNGRLIEKSYKLQKRAVLFDWGYNPASKKWDLPVASFFKDRAAAEKAIAGRINDCGLIVVDL